MATAKKKAGNRTAAAKRVVIRNRLYALVVAGTDTLATNVYGLPAIYATRKAAKDAAKAYPIKQYQVLRLNDVEGTIV